METKDRDEEYDREKPNKERFDYGMVTIKKEFPKNLPKKKDFTQEQQVEVQEKYQKQHQQISMIVHDERENKPQQVNIEENNDALLGVVKTNQTITLKFASAKVS
ncbi:hypothetical protein MTR_8g470990 [Medicago truncatula]|uniref:Uncharacterized protein n=1 Tax=Medicago truncatula TaxID=3880 RepID=A0A072U2F0_MEDTR|nr:hypothetical protein MTR_8g470990 [Medicago truncatula]